MFLKTENSYELSRKQENWKENKDGDICTTYFLMEMFKWGQSILGGIQLSLDGENSRNFYSIMSQVA